MPGRDGASAAMAITLLTERISHARTRDKARSSRRLTTAYPEQGRALLAVSVSDRTGAPTSPTANDWRTDAGDGFAEGVGRKRHSLSQAVGRRASALLTAPSGRQESGARLCGPTCPWLPARAKRADVGRSSMSTSPAGTAALRPDRLTRSRSWCGSAPHARPRKLLHVPAGRG